MLKAINTIIISALFIFALSNLSVSQVNCAGDSFTLHAESYVSGDLQWQYSYDGENWENYNGAIGTELVLILEEDTYLRLKITDPECMPAYYTDVQHVEILPQPDDANAGEDQLDLEVLNTTLSANQPVEGTGLWSITSGEGGNIENIYSNESTFTGTFGTTYTLRWLLFNDCGYTEDFVTISFVDNSFTCGDMLIDERDGQSYPTVEIGGKCWMASSLNIGTQITGSTNASDNGTIEKFCYNDVADSCAIYGGMYQWTEAMNYSTTESSQGICPNGWHIPSDGEVKQLEISLGMQVDDANNENSWRGSIEGVGTQMKEGGTSGFDIKMAGVRNSSGVFQYGIGNTFEFGYIWASTEAMTYPSETHAYRRCFRTASAGVGRYDTFPKQYSYSIRCIKND